MYFLSIFFHQIMGNQIHSFIISDKYAARVSNPYMYDTIRFVREFYFILPAVF